MFNDEQHAWLKALLERNSASKIAPSILPPTPKEPEKAAGGAGVVAKAPSTSDRIAELEALLAVRESELAAVKLNTKPVFCIIPHKELVFDSELGDGGFGIVHVAKWGAMNVAVKTLKMKDLPEKLVTEFKNEALLQAGLHHENVVELKGVCLEPKKYALVMELMSNGSLFNVLHNGKDLPWSYRLSIAKDIANGLSYLHQQGIIHQDLKSLNVLLDDRMRAKLADFGLSEIKVSTTTIHGAVGKDVSAAKPGSTKWMAPELFKRTGKCTESSDIYAMGMVFWELASREVPFKNARTESIAIEWIKDGEREDIPAETPVKMASLIKLCWAQKMEDRPKSAKAVLDELMGTVVVGGGASVSASSKPAEKSVVDSGYPMFSH